MTGSAGARCTPTRSRDVLARVATLAMEDLQMDDELRIGDLVVIMAEPGPFTIVEVDPPYVMIQGPTGTRRRVRDVAVRKVTSDPPVAR